ncbi:MAG: tRNA 2-thiouridine(34) synthase MnmA [Magnetococcales bacterium]|nr:tRNA 2-thiouridine(34) synthase MnmA [Magnetococcales bacterium]MBF0150495.1 tRNA 2-thiouridine(34) synthase MnmA [Magnetococcales bacterium]MBF0173653.1 tRNA 2-thiouridine(34) synthase MnmA [Magnetococcales bacterium]MBF0348352.1 tRNA 2-thiouridine(34) synthase MnmA [Magnetococcales bacterium]MBF0631420.1 tRNA 2-thiouridine(34) synthase MnmA [Magnetococcales bacterium]
MSGGVDSSVAAAWLVDQGYEVVGLTMRLWDSGVAGPTHRSCCSTTDVDDARRVAQTLGIPFYVVNMQSLFERDVVNPFLEAYATGRTPNPCMVCNQVMKFQHLLARAASFGADFLATGHYAVLRSIPGQPPQLFRGQDPRKDQSYFLASTPLEVLSRIRFPLGELSKEETRGLARKWGLHLADKRESQDVCFVPDGDYGTFFRRHGLEDRPGTIRGLDGTILGHHRGIHGYTIGQRRGLGIAAPHPLFVVAIDVEHNELIVGPESSLFGQSARLTRINWLVDSATVPQPWPIQAKIRYASKAVPATLEWNRAGDDDGTAMLRFDQPQRAITPGQACVFYEGSRVLGGGWIQSREPASTIL